MKWYSNRFSFLSGKTVAITGSTGGIGKELVAALNFLGARLILIDRNRKKAEKLRGKYPHSDITLITADMEDFSSVKAAAASLQQLKPDYLILNAGAYDIERRICDTSFDNVFQINFLSQYFLARSLSETVKRVVAVSSIAHNYSKINEQNIDFRDIRKASLAYGNAKRWLTLSLYSLFEHRPEKLSITHPGITFTGITDHYPKLIFALIKWPMKVIFMKPKKAARSVMEGLICSTKEGEWVGPAVLNIWGNPKKQRLKTYTKSELDFCKNNIEKIIKD